MKWPSFRDWAETRRIPIQYEERTDYYHIFGWDDQLRRSCKIYKSGYAIPSGSSTREEHDNWLLEFETGYKPDANAPIVKRSKNTRQVQMVAGPLEDSMVTYVSPNLCDPCTWYQSSDRVTEEELSDSGDQLTYESAQSNWIDIYRFDDVDRLTPSDYEPVIYRNGTTSSDVVDSSEYTVNYEDGTITFSSAQSGTDTIYADYSYENGSAWNLAADSGKILRLLHVELQMTTDVNLSSPARFQIMVGGQVANENVYRTIRSLISRSNRAYTLPALGDLSSDLIILPWLYQAVIDLKSSLGMSLQLLMENDDPASGEWATIGVYCISLNE